MRNMSASLTTQQCVNFSKTVTRRNGWDNIKPLEIVQLVEKGQGLKKGEKVKPIHKIQILSARKERLDVLSVSSFYGMKEMILEGFPGMDPKGFVEMYCRANKCLPSVMVNRIEFRYYMPRSINLVFKVPTHIGACLDCKQELLVAPRAFHTLSDGSVACKSFYMCCSNWNGEISRHKNIPEYDCVLEAGACIYLSYADRGPEWEEVCRSVKAWLFSTFRFEAK